MNQTILKLFLSILVFFALIAIVQNIDCSNGAYADVTSATEAKCLAKGFKWADPNCAAATTDWCVTQGLTAAICSTASGNTGIHCVLQDCSQGAYTGTGLTAGICGNKGMANTDATNCVAPTPAAGVCAALGPFSEILCKVASSNAAHCSFIDDSTACKTKMGIWDTSLTTHKCRVAADDLECWRIDASKQASVGYGPCVAHTVSSGAYTTCPINDANLFTLSTSATTKCKPVSDLGCNLLGYKLGSDGYCAKFSAISECDAIYGTGVTSISSGKCSPTADTQIAACAALGLKYSSGAATPFQCSIPTDNLGCPINNAALWTKVAGSPYCAPVTKSGCDVLGLTYVSTPKVRCISPAADANCPINNAKLWKKDATKLRCFPLVSAGCEVLGILFSSTTTDCTIAGTYSSCPLGDKAFFDIGAAGVCVPQQDIACQGLGFTFITGSPSSCGIPSAQKDCPIVDTANIWTYTDASQRCVAWHNQACLHLGLIKSGTKCRFPISSDCTSLSPNNYFILSTSAPVGLCVPSFTEACQAQGMIFSSSSKPCKAAYNLAQCQSLNPDLKFVESGVASSSYDFGCFSTSTIASNQIRDCLTLGLTVGSLKCELSSSTLSATYNSLLYTLNGTTQLIYPLLDVKYGCQQYTLGYSSGNSFCSRISDASTCKSNGLIWEETYAYDDLSQNNCQGKKTTACRLPVNASECTSVGTYYYVSDPSIRLGTNLYTCMLQAECGANRFLVNNACYSSCSSLDGYVTTTPSSTAVKACAKCNTGCRVCASETTTTSCSACIKGYYGITTNNTCAVCSIGNCLSCSSATSCLACKTGYKIYNNGTTDTCVSCTDFLAGCSTCDLDSTGKVTKCSTCQDSIISAADGSISKCVCSQYSAVATLRTSIESPTIPYISASLSSYDTLLAFYYQIKCKWLEILPTTCDASSPIIDSTKDLAILNQVLTQFITILGQSTKSLSDSGFDKIKSIPALLALYLKTPLSKAIDSATINKGFSVLTNVNLTSSLDSYVAAVNGLLLKSSSNYVDFSASIASSIAFMNSLMAFETNNAQTLSKDIITYDAYVFQFVKPVGIQAGVTFDVTGSNVTYFDGKVTDFTKAKVLVSRVNLAKVTKAASVNTTITTSEEVQFTFGQVTGATDATTNVTKYTFAAIDALTIPTKSCVTFSIKLKADYTLTDKSKVIYIAQWDDTKKIWDVNALTTSSVTQPYTGCTKSFAQPFIVTEAKKKGSFSNLLAISFGLIASLFLLF